jgi:TM2 domain-containing membrane protein YozV
VSYLVAQERILLAFLAGNAQDAKQQILKYSLRRLPKDSSIVVYEVLVLAALEEWETAKRVIMENSALIGLTTEEAASVVPEKIKWKNPDKAFNLSFFLPGVGQMYAGYPVRGLVSGGIQAALVGFSAYSIYQGYFFTGAMTGVALFYTFYFGGARYASRLAGQHNHQITNKIQQNFLKTLENKKALN